jgi:hypothetical protein
LATARSTSLAIWPQHKGNELNGCFTLGLISSTIRAMATGPISTYPGVTIKQALQSYYALDGSPIDSIGGRNLAASSANYTAQADNGGQSMRPNASAAAAPTPAFLTKNFTIFGWVNVHSAASHYPLGAFNNSSHSECCVLYRDQSGNYAWVFASGGVNRTGAGTDEQLPLNTWVFVAVTYDGTNAIGYMNSKVGTAQPFALNIDTPATFQLGDAGVTNTFVNEYDEVGVCNRALTPTEIAWLYNDGKRRSLTEFVAPVVQDPSVDPYFSNVSLLMHGDGAAFSKTFIDSSPRPKTLSSTGQARINGNVMKFGTGSLQPWEDGTIKAVLGAEGLMTGDFTLEFWVRAPGACLLMSEGGSYIYNNSFQGPWGVIALPIFTPADTNLFDFVAITRNGNQLRTFYNGQLKATLTTTAVIDLQTIELGRYIPNNNLYTTAEIDDLRITKGVARYTANFTVPTVAFPDIGAPVPGASLADVKAIFTELGATGGIWDFTNFDSLAANSGTGAPAVVDGNIDMVRDLSGNGNHMVSQGNVAVLRKEGNNYYAEFNGAGGFLRSMNVGSSLGYEMYASTRFTATNTQSSPIGGDVAYQRVAQTILFPSDAANISQAIVWFEAQGADHYLADPNLYPIANADDRIFGFRIDPSGAKLYTNGVEVASDPRQVTINGKEPMPFGLGVDAQGTNTFQYRRHVGRFFGMVVINKPLNATQRKTIHRYLASRMTKPITIT